MPRFTRVLAHISDETFIATILDAASAQDAADSMGVTTRTLRHDLAHRGLPGFIQLRAQHGIKSVAPTPWTGAMIDQLKALHREGKSAALIGAEMGLTKNAVIGKASRIGIKLGAPTTRKEGAPRRQRSKKIPYAGSPDMAPIKRHVPRKAGEPSVMPSRSKQEAARRASAADREADRALIEQAIAEGRITRCAPGHAWNTNLKARVMGIEL
ncbi:MAG TPA: GcrA family cell cycle regulator [Devosia sp.]|jgi:hypothetical protein|uniref:GcrA family cell cycle regulator n=1 Tax=Devosia sp. TaxID=1871048 RepID=UPI002F95A16B